MFRTQGSARSGLQNRILAGYLAFVGGFVNSVGFVEIGTFTSHVTGLVGRASHELARGELAASGAAASMIVAFFAGAFLASVIVESRLLRSPSRAYAVALVLEAALLIAFSLWTWSTWATAHPRLMDAQGHLLCAAMGMQNSLVTRLSGAVVRTTHLTGVVTDLGIEAARWFRYWRRHASQRLHVRLVAGPNAVEVPNTPKVLLLATIAGAFSAGAILGAALALRLAHAATLLAAGAVLVFAMIAARDGLETRAEVVDSRR